MARPQEFDTDQALEQALVVFRRKGFVASSLTDILDATGLSKSSLYATFDSKHALFLRAFDVYRDQRRKVVAACLRQGTARDGLEAYLRHIVQGAHEAPRESCMTLRQTVEMSSRDTGVRARVHGDFAELLAAFTATIQRGQADGSIASRAPAEVLANTLTISALGLMVAGQTGLAPEVSDGAVTQLMNLLDAGGCQAPQA